MMIVGPGLRGAARRYLTEYNLSKKGEYMRKVLFARIGWMTYYKGIQTGDSRAYGGGEYNKKHVGGESRNFVVRSRKVYGAFANQMRANQLNIARIDPKSSHGSTSKVLVIFFAKHRDPSIGQVVVGWHQNSTVHSQLIYSPWWHFTIAPSKEAVLLPTNRRTCVVPHGSSKLVAPGRSNVFFALDAAGEPRNLSWVRKVLEFVDSYHGPNLLTDPDAELESTLDEVVESRLSSDTAQGFQSNPEIRKVIEGRAMDSAKWYFNKKGFMVQDVSSTQSYDLLCRKGKQKLFMEVKGSQGPISKIVLTPNEVKFLTRNKGNIGLFLLDSISLQQHRKRYSAKGGTKHIVLPWRIQSSRLKPFQYLYEI